MVSVKGPAVLLVWFPELFCNDMGTIKHIKPDAKTVFLAGEKCSIINEKESGR